MFLKANFEHIPDYGAIPMIAAKDIRACLPTRFTGKGADLVAAEAGFDLPNNPAASSAQDKGMDEGWRSLGGGGLLLFLLQLHYCGRLVFIRVTPR